MGKSKGKHLDKKFTKDGQIQKNEKIAGLKLITAE